MVINYGLDLERFVNLPSADWQEPLRFLMVGRLVRQKSQITALQALNNLKDYPWHLTIVGEGIEKNNLQAFVQKNNLQDRIEFVEPLTGVEQYYLQADVFLMPSLWEGLGIVVMEAMSSGRLVLASDTTGLKEIVQDKKTGYLAQSENISDWEEKIKYIFENKTEGKNLAKNAQKYAKENFGVDRMVKKYDELYSLVASK